MSGRNTQHELENKNNRERATSMCHVCVSTIYVLRATNKSDRSKRTEPPLADDRPERIRKKETTGTIFAVRTWARKDLPEAQGLIASSCHHG